MHKARAFFFVCAGLFLVAVIHQFGAQIAGAQAPGNPVVAVSDPWVYTANGDCYQLTSSAGEWAYRGNVFRGSGAPGNTVVAVSDPWVYTANGDCYQLTSSAGEWAYRGNVFSSSTSAQGISIGQLKAKYAAPATGK